MAQKRMVEMSVGSTVIPLGLLPSGDRALCLLSPAQSYLLLWISFTAWFISLVLRKQSWSISKWIGQSSGLVSCLTPRIHKSGWLRDLGCWKNNTVHLLWWVKHSPVHKHTRKVFKTMLCCLLKRRHQVAPTHSASLLFNYFLRRKSSRHLLLYRTVIELMLDDLHTLFHWFSQKFCEGIVWQMR